MKILKLSTYENIQLECKDGRLPTGSYSRLAKTFLADNYDMSFLPGIGVSLRSKETGFDAQFVIPFANIPYLVTEPDGDQIDHNIVRRRGRPRRTIESAPQAQGEGLPEGSDGAN